MQILKLLPVIFLLAILPMIAAAQGTSWILEATEGPVRLKVANSIGFAAEEIKAPPQRPLRRGDRLLLNPGASVRIFDGALRSTHRHDGATSAPVTITVPASATSGSVASRLMSGAASRRRQSAQAGTLVRALELRTGRGGIEWPPVDLPGFDDPTTLTIRTRFLDLMGNQGRLELLRVESPGDQVGTVISTHDFPISEGVHDWKPDPSVFADGTFFLVRLTVNGTPHATRGIWQQQRAMAELESRLADEVGVSVEELRRSPIHEYLREEMTASLMTAPPE